MVPIHESDVAENRWKESEWNAYELWEVVEVRERRRKIWMTALACALGLFILSLPIYNEKTPKREGLRYARVLADHLLDIRRDASHSQKKFLIQVRQSEGGKITGQVYDLSSTEECGTVHLDHRTPVSTFPVAADEQKEIALLTPKTAGELGLQGISDSICFDPFRETSGETETFAFIPVKDLTERREDRISTLTVVDAASFSFD